MSVVRNQLIIIVLCLVPYASWGSETKLDSDVKALAGVSAGEQEDARDAATMGAFNSGAQFLVKGVGAASAILTAKQLRELAASVSETDDSEDSEISWDMSDSDADSAARTGSVTGTEVATSAATEAEAEEEMRHQILGKT